jgi:hypothetical protein
MNFDARLRAGREPVITNASVRSTWLERRRELPCAPGLDSTITASKVRLLASLGNAATSFAVVIAASLKTCLSWLCRSGSPLNNKILKTEDESVMEVSPEEEARIIAQSRFDVNEEIDGII